MSPPGRTLGREPKDGQAHLALSWGCSQCPASPPPQLLDCLSLSTCKRVGGVGTGSEDQCSSKLLNASKQQNCWDTRWPGL